jgi:hypothetical protein
MALNGFKDIESIVNAALIFISDFSDGYVYYPQSENRLQLINKLSNFLIKFERKNCLPGLNFMLTLQGLFVQMKTKLFHGLYTLNTIIESFVIKHFRILMRIIIRYVSFFNFSRHMAYFLLPIYGRIILK